MDTNRVKLIEKQMVQLTKIVHKINNELRSNKTLKKPKLPLDATKAVATVVSKYKGKKQDKNTLNCLSKEVGELLLSQWNILGVQLRCKIETDDNEHIVDIEYDFVGIPVCDPTLPKLLKRCKFDGKKLRVAVDERGILHYEWDENPNFGYLHPMQHSPVAYETKTFNPNCGTSASMIEAYKASQFLGQTLSAKSKKKVKRQWTKWLSITKLIPKRDPMRRYRRRLMKAAKANHWCVLAGLQKAPQEVSKWKRTLTILTLGLVSE